MLREGIHIDIQKSKDLITNVAAFAFTFAFTFTFTRRRDLELTCDIADEREGFNKSVLGTDDMRGVGHKQLLG
jgi:hypothetical protein